MKKIIFFVGLMIFMWSASTAFATKSDPASEKSAVPVKTENKLSEEEISHLTRRVEEIRDMDKTNLTLKEKRELRKELKVIKESLQRNPGYVYIGTGTLILIIILVILLV
jgi:hypothetical protein